MENFKRNLQMFLVVLAIGAICCGIGWHKGTQQKMEQLEQQEVEHWQNETEKMEQEDRTKHNVKVTTLKIVPYFPAEEIKIIIAAAERNNLKPELYPILFAIRKAENGSKSREFGIIHPKCEKIMAERPDETLDIQAGWAAATVQKNYDRWVKAGKQGTYIAFLGKRYCPVEASNDPNNLNQHWIGNVKEWVVKVSG